MLACLDISLLPNNDIRSVACAGCFQSEAAGGPAMVHRKQGLYFENLVP